MASARATAYSATTVLPEPGGGGDHHAVAGVESVHGLELEGVGTEGQAGHELRAQLSVAQLVVAAPGAGRAGAALGAGVGVVRGHRTFVPHPADLTRRRAA